MSEWIRIEDQLPEHGQRVLALARGADQPFCATFFTDRWITSAGHTVKNITDTYEFWQAVPMRSEIEAKLKEKNT